MSPVEIVELKHPLQQRRMFPLSLSMKKWVFDALKKRQIAMENLSCICCWDHKLWTWLFSLAGAADDMRQGRTVKLKFIPGGDRKTALNRQ